MGGHMVSLSEIKNALAGINGGFCADKIDRAIAALKEALEEMDTIPVCGRHDVDALLGCMIGIDLIIGEEKHG